MPGSRTDDQTFRRILYRNITLPLAAGVVSAAVFVAILAYLLNALNLVEHSERVIGNAQELRKLAVDMETGVRGYLLTGEEPFLAPYRLAKPKIETALNTLGELVSENPRQMDRLRNIRAQQLQWDKVAQDLIRARTTGGDYLDISLIFFFKSKFSQINHFNVQLQ